MTVDRPQRRGMRADARRNYDALLAAGRAVFAEQGVDAAFDEVARRAGVGRGTLYRHFPTREHLFAVLVQDQVALLERRASRLAAEPDAGEAVAEWLRLYERSAREYAGMSRRVAEELAGDGSPLAVACAPMRRAFEALFARAQREGAVRRDITALDTLALVAALPRAGHRHGAGVHLDVVLDGLRYPAKAGSGCRPEHRTPM